MTAPAQVPAASPVDEVLVALRALLSDLVSGAVPLDRSRADVAEVEARFRAFLPALRLHLVAHREPFDGSTSHDVVIRGLGPALSLGIAGSPGLPWPLRGTVRVDDRRLLRVDGQYLGVDEAMTVLDDAFCEPVTLRLLVKAVLVRRLLAEHDVVVDDGQLQQTADAFRRANGLLSAEATRQWLSDRGLTDDAFAAQLHAVARVQALRRNLTADRVDAALADRPDRYDSLSVAWTADPGPWPSADDPIGAVIAAHTSGRDAGVTRWRGCELPAGCALLGTAEVGACVPVTVSGTAAHAVVLARVPAAPDQATRTVVERDVFDTVLDEQLRRSDVQWFWGEAGRTRLVQG